MRPIQAFYTSSLVCILVIIITCASQTLLAQQIAADWQSEAWAPNADVKVLAESNERVFAGTLNSGLFYSDNSGESWTAAVNGLTLRNISSLVVAGNAVFAAGSQGLFRSSDNGESWQELFIRPGKRLRNITSMTQHKNSIVAATSTELHFSDDNGENWESIPHSTIPKAGVYFLQSDGSSLMFASSDALYFFDQNSKEVVKRQSFNAPISMIKVIDAQVFIATLTQNTNQKLQVYIGSLSTPEEAGWSLPSSAIVLDLIEHNQKFYCVTTRGVFESAEGRNWSELRSGSDSAPFQSLTATQNFLLLGTVTRSTFRCDLSDPDSRLTQVADGMTAWSPYRIWHSSEFIFAHSNGTGTLFKERKQSGAWTKLVADFPAPLLSSSDFVEFNDELLLASNVLFHSTDNGRTWAVRPNLAQQDIVHNIATTSNDIFGFNRHEIVRYSADGEITRIQVPVTNGFHDALGIGETLIASLFDGRMLRSTDYAQSWQEFGEGLSSRPMGHLLASDEFIVGATSVAVFISSDAGNNWKNISTDQPFENEPVLNIAEYQGIIYIVTRNGAWFTSDQGNHWTELNRTGIPEYVQFSSLSIYQDEIFLGSYGDGLFRTRLEPPVTSTDNFDAQTLTFTISPNPIKHKATVSLDITSAAQLNVQIYDLRGNLVLADDGMLHDSGQFTQELDVSALSTGSYLLVLNIGEQMLSRQFSVVK